MKKEDKALIEMNHTTQIFDAFDMNSWLVTGDGCYDMEESVGFIMEKSVMLEDDFKEAASKMAKEFSYWLNNNWFIPTTDGNWKQDISNPEYQVSVEDLKINSVWKTVFWNDDELFEMFNNKKGSF